MIQCVLRTQNECEGFSEDKFWCVGIYLHRFNIVLLLKAALNVH